MGLPENSGVHRIAEVVELRTSEAAAAKPAPAPVREGRVWDSSRTPAAPGLLDPPSTDLNRTDLYLNRELTYLNFNWRVLHEADDDRVPLLERLKFIAIVAANLDEFFQKRIGGLKQQVGAQVQTITADGRSPSQQITDCLELITQLEARRAEILERVLVDLRALNVGIVPYRELDAFHQAWVREHYVRNIFPW